MEIIETCLFNYASNAIEVKNKSCHKDPNSMPNVPVAAQQPQFPSSPLQTSQSTAERASTNDWLVQLQAQEKSIISSPSKHGQDEDKKQ